MSFVYLDWAATAPPDPEIQEQVQRISRERFANPSAIHKEGREAERLLGQCRQRLAAVLGCHEQEVVFTSGGTEGNNMVLFSLAQKKRDRKIVLTGIEHPSIYEPAQSLGRLGFEVVTVPAERGGQVDAGRLERALDERTVLVAVMMVNNETGALQPLAEVAAAIRDLQRRSGKKILFHCDAVQALGKIPFDLASMDIDSASFSAHKIGGPRGVGALYVRKGRIRDFLYCGGGQELGRRPGTENLPGIFGFVLALEKAKTHLQQNLEQARAAIRAFLPELLEIPGAVVTTAGREQGREAAFSPYILNVSFPPLPGEVLVRVLEEEGFLVSTGSACSSKKKDRFRVLEGMGVPREVAFSALRISTGPGIGSDHLQGLAQALRRRLPELKAAAAL